MKTPEKMMIYDTVEGNQEGQEEPDQLMEEEHQEQLRPIEPEQQA